MLAELKIYHVGKQHGGIDAVRNVARIVSRMIWDGKTLQLTYQFGRKYVAAPKGQKPHVSALHAPGFFAILKAQNFCVIW